MIALFAGLSWGKLLLKALPWIMIVVLCGVLWGVWGWKEAAEADKAIAEAKLATALQVNQDNALEMLKLERQQESDRRMSEAAIKAAQERAATTSKIKKEQRNAPDSNDRLSPYWGDFFDRLREQP